MEEETKLVKEILSTHKVNDVLSTFVTLPSKNTEASIFQRQKGNKLFVKKKHTSSEHEMIWKFYTKSIALVPCKDNENLEILASSYGNRSALLFHIGKFKESIIDANRALKITKLDTLRDKLLNRKEKCLSAIKENEKQTCSCIERNVMDCGIEMSQDCLKSRRNTHQCKTQVQEILLAAKDPADIVYPRYNKKYGRHLIAKRDIKPGEIIMSLKPYVRAINMNNRYAFCGHCLKTAWTGIPCDNCSWCIFCSEECKQEALQKYHDIECGIGLYITLNNENGDYYKQLALRLVVMSIRQAGSIAKLRQELHKIDSCAVGPLKGFVNGKFPNDMFHGFYSLSKDVSPSVMESLADQSVLTLIWIAKGSTLFDAKFKTNNDLLSNKDAVFVGSLLLRFLRICDINTQCVNEGSSQCRFSNSNKTCMETRCCERGVCMAGLSSLINHSCFPNVRKCYTEDMQQLVYALQPIPKNTQLFDSYSFCFFGAPKTTRQSSLQDGFNFLCNCIACKEDWPLILGHKDYKDIPDVKTCEFEEDLLDNYDDFIKSINRNYDNSDVSSIKYLSDNIIKATRQLIQPCRAAPLFMLALWNVFDNLFGHKLKIPDLCQT